MPFTSTPDLPPNPAVRIFFIGQLILEPVTLPSVPPAPPGVHVCEVFVNRAAPDHHLSIEVRRKRPGKPDQIMMRHTGRLPFAEAPRDSPPKYGFFISVTNGPEGVKHYDGTNASAEGKSLLDHAFNMKKVHEGVPTGPVDPSGGRPSILIDDAVFYTADIMPNANLKKKKPGSQPQPQSDRAAIIGANIYLPSDKSKKVNLAWRQDGRDVKLDLERSDDFSYEIYINNEPLYEDDTVTSPFTHDEFREFYKILPGVPHDEQFELTFPTPIPAPTRGTTRTPCTAVLLNE